MRKTITVAALLAGAVSAYSQGQVEMQDYGVRTFEIVLYNAQTSGNNAQVTYNGYTVNEEQGNVSTTTNPLELNPGTTVYASGGLLQGRGFDAQLLAAPGPGDPLSALLPAGSPVNFFTTASGLGGLFEGLASPVPIPGAAQGPGSSATVAIAAWVNNGAPGVANTLAAAQTYGYAWGISTVGNVEELGGGVYVPAVLPASVESFSLGAVPEPSTIALGVIGASAFLMRLRRK